MRHFLRGGSLFGAMALALSCVFSAGSCFAQSDSSASGQKAPFKLGVEEKFQMSEPSYPSYPAPVMVPQTPRTAPPPKPVHKPPMHAAVEQTQRPPAPQPPSRPPMNMGIQQTAPPGVLPSQFLGAWQVLGQRSKVEALPQFQSGIDGIFTGSNSQVWQISGDPGQGYAFVSNTGVRSQVYVDKVQGNTAYLRYQHPIRNTMAQEAIVMMLSPDGSQFQGLERISIVKQGEPGPRAKVTYNLVGRRQ